MLTDKELQEKLDRDIEKYLGKGGKITQCEPFTFSGGKSYKDPALAFNVREAKRDGRSK
jgi:hypothetical protein